MGKSTITEPVRINESHTLHDFNSGEKRVDSWLKRHSLSNSYKDASRTFVITQENKKAVIGFYAWCMGSLSHEIAIGKVRRNMPDPIPLAILGRLAVDKRFQGQSLGSFLIRDAMLRTLSISQEIACSGLLVHALHDKASRFYSTIGFEPMLKQPNTMFISTKALTHALIEM